MSPLKAVNPFISQKRMVISRREPWASANSGRSIAFAAAQLRQRWIGNLWICALLDIPQRREVEVAIDFVGFTIGDVFVVGYGTDYAEKYRHLPYIGAVE